jgi:hypothetical protein
MRGVMRRAVMVIGVVGLGMPAAAGHYYYGLEVSLTFDRTTIGIGETAVATMTASWDNSPRLTFASVNVDLIASGAFVTVSDIAPVAWNNPVLGFNGQGVASGADIIGLQASQFTLIPPHSADNPILITTFVVTGIAEGLLSYHSVNAAGAPFPYSIEEFTVGGPVIDPPGNEVFVSQTLVVTPGPGVVGVLGVAGVVGVWRRRG